MAQLRATIANTDVRINDDNGSAIRQELERSLMDRHGPMLGGLDLCKALGYPSATAFRQALLRGSVAVRVFNIPNQRGRFALTRDVAAWLAQCHSSAGVESQGDSRP